MGGGITEARIAQEECEKQGLKFTPHSWTNGLGFLINLHVYASGRMDAPFEYPFDPPGWVPEYRDGILESPLYADGSGMVPVPNEPGFGFHISRSKLRKYGTRFFKMTPTSLAVKTIREKGLSTAMELRKRKAQKASGSQS